MAFGLLGKHQGRPVCPWGGWLCLHVARLASWPALGLGCRNIKLGRHYTLGNAPVETVRRPRVVAAAVPLLPLCLSGITCISQPTGCIGTRLRFDTCFVFILSSQGDPACDKGIHQHHVASLSDPVQDVTATKGHDFEDYFLKRELLMGIYEKVCWLVSLCCLCMSPKVRVNSRPVYCQAGCATASWLGPC